MGWEEVITGVEKVDVDARLKAIASPGDTAFDEHELKSSFRNVTGFLQQIDTKKIDDTITISSALIIFNYVG